MYLATLALFLACLVGGMLVVAAVSQRVSFHARCNEFLSRQHTLLQTMAEDIGAVQSSRPSALPELLAYHGRVVGAEGIGLAVWRDGALQYNSQPMVEERPELATLAPGQRSWQVRLCNGRHVLFATTALSDSLQDYVISASADIESFYQDWTRISGLLAVGCGALCLLFALALFGVLRRMNRPLGDLTATARALAGGDFSARAQSARRDELGELARTLNKMAEQVEEQLASLAGEAANKQRLVDNLSHEMRTPLTAIGGYAEYIQRARLSPGELQEATDIIRHESDRLAGLADQLVRLSLLNHEPLRATLLHPKALLQRAWDVALPKAGNRGVKLQAELSPGCPSIWGSGELLESLVVNLLDNGIKACERGGVVTLRLKSSPQGGCVIEVADTGQGMDAETLAKIGQPFYRADKARSRAQGGAGLGAALCFAIVQAHGGTLRYASTPGVGTTAVVTLPPLAEASTNLQLRNDPDTPL